MGLVPVRFYLRNLIILRLRILLRQSDWQRLVESIGKQVFYLAAFVTSGKCRSKRFLVFDLQCVKQ